jgi:hypothetical protein
MIDDGNIVSGSVITSFCETEGIGAGRCLHKPRLLYSVYSSVLTMEKKGRRDQGDIRHRNDNYRDQKPASLGDSKIHDNWNRTRDIGCGKIAAKCLRPTGTLLSLFVV